MHVPPTKIDRAVEAAAELRAAGHSWAHIAAALRRARDTVRRWPRRYPDVWARTAADTRRDLFLGAGGEALNILRNLLRSDDDRTRRDAARDLVRLSVDSQPADPQTPVDPLADYIGGLSDDDCRRLLDEHRARKVRPGTRAGGPGETAPGADGRE